MPKSIEDHFADWESHVFGFGYGTGEEHTLAALKGFFGALGKASNPNAYWHLDLEKALTPTVAWLMINTLCHADIIEYGTSPRGGWLTEQGIALREFVSSKTVAELEDICQRDSDYYGCFHDHCNCDGEPCHNPFWEESSKRGTLREPLAHHRG